ncbi:hypothetical protein PoB_005253800 [Plakobranchus ocellatus]|uniref:Reverse transcriptase domain-containing protein n=1 Tax=Plakobranchus ocellatus TaxID=259542 RepID=A0AAV4C296_9GAST|nr:hypothetical protein PoB_005253800 [Plakobranchus ocellatus]
MNKNVSKVLRATEGRNRKKRNSLFTPIVVTSSSNNSSVSVFQTTTKTKPNRRWVKRNVYKRKQTVFNTTNATVINLSSHILTDPQTQLLSRNLNFCPTPHHINHIELSEDIHRFCRRLRLAEFFYEENIKPHEPLPSFLQKPSSFTPSAGRDPALDAFIKLKAVTKDLMTCQPRKCFLNIRTEEKRALKELKNNADIIIKPADKGGAVVVLNTTDYIAECTRQLSNATYYRKLNSDPTKKYNKRISDRLEIGVRSGEIDSDSAKRLIVPHPVPGRFYILPKIHKEGNPGRPIISGNGCPTEIISLFVDYHLKDLIRLVPSYVQEDMDFLRKIHNINAVGPLPPDTILCTMDVSALYTNIPHEEGIGACKSALETWRDPNSTPSSSFLCDLIKIILSYM